MKFREYHKSQGIYDSDGGIYIVDNLDQLRGIIIEEMYPCQIDFDEDIDPEIDGHLVLIDVKPDGTIY